MANEIVAERSMPKLPGSIGIWTFIAADSSMFGFFFYAYVMDRAAKLPEFLAAQQSMSFVSGFINTLLLLTSSYLVALAVRAVRLDRLRAATVALGLAVACGLGFVVVKIFEYADKLVAGHSMLSGDFYMFYFIITGIHAVHVLVGLTILAVNCWWLGRGVYSSRSLAGLESAASYWHMVDFLWVMIFPLLYLLR